MKRRQWPVSANPTYPADLCPLFRCGEFAYDCEDLGETVGDAVKAAERSAVGQGAPVHFYYVLCGEQGINDSVQAGAGRGELYLRLRCEMTGLGAGQVKLTLQVGESDIEVQHGHLGRSVTE